MKSLCLKIIIVVVSFSIKAGGGEPLLVMADSLKAGGFFYDAITEYKRLLFFDKLAAGHSDVNSKIGFCYAYLGEYENSAWYFDKAMLSAENDSIKEHRMVDGAVTEMVFGDTDHAIMTFYQLLRESPYPDIRNRAGTNLFLAMVLEHDWPAAYDIFIGNISDTPFALDSISVLLENALNISYKSPKTAELMSMIIPGTGQIYAGGFWAGLNAMVINGATSYLTFNEIINERFITGTVSFLFLFQRYYSGNRFHAARIAAEHNDRRDRFYENLIIEQIARNYGLTLDPNR